MSSERMSGIVADTLVRIYDTNLAKLDGLALKTWLVTFRINQVAVSATRGLESYSQHLTY
jgi:hypothetical protein